MRHTDEDIVKFQLWLTQNRFLELANERLLVIDELSNPGYYFMKYFSDELLFNQVEAG